MKGKVNIKKIEKATRLLLEAVGEDITREGLIQTPKRVAKLYEEILSGKAADIDAMLETVFDIDTSQQSIVIEKDIAFYSLCEHHLLPFFGKAHIAYLPDQKVLGLSKIARLVDAFARRIQLQEQMTNQIADALFNASALSCKGVFVLLEAEHLCLSMRGIKKAGARTLTMAKRGVFENDRVLFNEMLECMRMRI